MHGTSVQNALSIIIDGAINPSHGACGVVGVNTLMCKSLKDDDLIEAYTRSATAGYNKGACFVIVPEGILVKCKSSEVVPPGCISFKEKTMKLRTNIPATPAPLTSSYQW